METTSTSLPHGAAGHPTPAAEPRLAGDLAIWVFIMAELLAFGAFFAAYAFTRANNIELFNAEQAGLDRTAGAINTILLLTSSYFVVRAVQAAELRAARAAANWLLAAIVTGLGFGAIALALTTGALWFFLWREGSPSTHEAKEVHEAMATLVEVYFVGHGGMATLHFLAWLKQRGGSRPRP